MTDLFSTALRDSVIRNSVPGAQKGPADDKMRTYGVSGVTEQHFSV